MANTSRDEGGERLIVEEEDEGSGRGVLEEESHETIEIERKPRVKWARQKSPPPSATTFRTRRSCKVSCGYAVCTIMLVAIAIVLSTSVGLFVGQSLGRRAVHHDDGGGGGGGGEGVVYDWGDTVTVDGHKQNVSDYFIANIKADDIKSYLS